MILAASVLVVWIVFSVVALAGAVAILVWAVRSGQFTGQDRARYFPLESPPQDVGPEAGDAQAGGAEKPAAAPPAPRPGGSHAPL